MHRRKIGLALIIASLAVSAGAAWAVVTVGVGTNVNITQSAGSQAEGTIAINPANPMQLFAANNPPAPLFYRSTNGGSTWTSTTVAGSHCCDNVAAFDNFGNLFLTNLPSPVTSIPLFLSTDGGANFGAATTLDTGSVDQPSLDAGAGAVWVTWNDGSIKARGAAVTGLGAVGAFNAEQSPPGAAGVVGQFGDIAIGPGGEVVVTYQSGAGNGPGSIFVNTDADGLGAGGFGAQVTVTGTNVGKFDSITPQDSRTVDAEANLSYDRSGGPFNGRLYLAYTEETPDESNNTDILLRFSDDDGATWSAAVPVSDDVTARAQFNPALTVDQTSGVVAVTWHDARNDPGNNNTQYWGAVSDTGGVSFQPNFQISAGTSNEDVAGSTTDYGDYTWNDFFGGMLFPIWADNSNSTGDNPAGANSTFDMYTAKISVAGPPATLTLSPKTDTNQAGQQHCVTATVVDAFGNPTPGITVRFSVTGSNPTSGSAPTDANGQAQFCYTGTVAGADAITAYADTNNNSVQDVGEPSDTAAKTWTPGPPATLTLSPKTATNTVDAQHCVTATVEDAFGNPTPGITVRFTVTGSVNTSGSAVTDANGQATFCYTGPALPGADVISAYADTNNNSVQDVGEPSDTASKQWVLPPSTPGCKVTNGGRITAANGDKATFGGNAQVPASGPKGQEQYQDHGPAQPMNVHSINVQAVTCSADKTQASIFGQATINGSGTFDYRIDVKDLGEPGTNDTYRIRLSNGYDSGEQTLEGGNVKIQ